MEMNPVRAASVGEAGDYERSSAAAHLEVEDGQHVVDMGFWAESGGAARW